MFGFGNKGKIEEQMAEWLAHPQEFGVRPRGVRHKRAYKATLMGQGNVEIHLVEYSMPDGTVGRGFVNGPLTWSFVGDEVNAIGDDDLFRAYCGWSFLFPALQAGHIQTQFESPEEAAYVAEKHGQGLTDVAVTTRYKLGTSEFYEFTGRFEGQRVTGAGNTKGEVGYAEDNPCFHLPPIYFLLGQLVLQAVR